MQKICRSKLIFVRVSFFSKRLVLRAAGVQLMGNAESWKVGRGKREWRWKCNKTGKLVGKVLSFSVKS